MHEWLILFIARWLSGERFRKARTEDYRLGFGSLFLTGIFMIVGTVLGGHFLDRASFVSIWIVATVATCFLFFGIIVWARLVPAAVSLILAIMTWGVVIWLAT